ncbi:ATP-binding protein [Sphingobacterium paucimobilis]|uniref:DUF4143 domain-containing protein n=1 Tax=Sphingobacterium paucimobilis HER1398 TaxID=1346330 RepID=U2I051_9SPHI|nr:ATP-binding protein [Sphingobacterium paucimobilis]ERJ60900.1 hypothetical protein M472_19275 [Sphingobacterium paucimobilis HER1398]
MPQKEYDIHETSSHLTKSIRYTVYVGKLGNKEIDFIGDRNGTKIYVQVCLTLLYENTIAREFGNLKDIEDNYPKYVITFNDPMIGDNHGGILQRNLIDFLMMDI